MRDVKAYLATLSHRPGVYQMLGKKGEVLYVGKAKDLKKRVSSYFAKRKQDLKTQKLLKHLADINVVITNTESEAVLLECNLIKKHQPRYNVLLRDDKSYPYILISEHDYPRIDFYRGRRFKNGFYFGPYPSAQTVRETISLLQKLFRIRTCRDAYFAARTRPCLLYQIERCTGPCVQFISLEEYKKNVGLAKLFLEGKSQLVIEALQQAMENAANDLNYELASQIRDQIKRLHQILNRQYVHIAEGNADVIGFATEAGVSCIHLLSIRDGQVQGSHSYFPTAPHHSTKLEIISAFLTQHYLNHPSHTASIPKEIIVDTKLADQDLLQEVLSEITHRKVTIVSPVRTEKKKWLTMASTTAKQALASHLFAKSNMQERIFALQQVLQLKKIPERLECFDVSHTMGEATVASCVVFDKNGPVKSEYRRFNIKDITPGDDLAAMRQTLQRRFKHVQDGETILPDVVFIDGGRTQLAVAVMVLKELKIKKILLVGVSKGPLRKPGLEKLHIGDRPPIHLDADSKALHFIQQIRDEAHRFAITAHRSKRSKTRRESFLQAIPGVGVKRRRDLLRYFGGIQGIAHASLDELIKVPGINRSLAERIFALFHDETI